MPHVRFSENGCLSTYFCQTRLLQLSSLRYLKSQHNEVTTFPERPGTCRSTEKVGIALGANVEGVALASICPAHRL